LEFKGMFSFLGRIGRKCGLQSVQRPLFSDTVGAEEVAAEFDQINGRNAGKPPDMFNPFGVVAGLDNIPFTPGYTEGY
jgi:hypothetical protein